MHFQLISIFAKLFCKISLDLELDLELVPTLSLTIRQGSFIYQFH